MISWDGSMRKEKGGRVGSFFAYFRVDTCSMINGLLHTYPQS
jgi:hypothetical protein